MNATVVAGGHQHGVGGAASVFATGGTHAHRAAVDDEQGQRGPREREICRPLGEEELGCRAFGVEGAIVADIGGGFVDAVDGAGKRFVGGAGDEHVFGDAGHLIGQGVIVDEPAGVVGGAAVHGHHPAGVVEGDHQRRRQIGEPAADDVAQGFLGAQELHEPSILDGRRRRGVDDAGRQRSQGQITGTAGQVCPQRDQARVDLEGLRAADAVVASDDDTAQVEVFNRRQHALERPEVAVDVAQAQQGPTRRTGRAQGAVAFLHPGRATQEGRHTAGGDDVVREGPPAVHSCKVPGDAAASNVAKRARQSGTAGGASPPPSHRPITLWYSGGVDVLVVDPGELGELLTTLLTQYGLKAAQVQTGQQALRIAFDARPAVVVIEADLGDASGLDLAELLQRELGCKIVLTHPPGLGANAPSSSLGAKPDARTRMGGLDAAFSRPFRSLALIETVARLANKVPGTRGVTPAWDDPTAKTAANSSSLPSTEGPAIDEFTDLTEAGDDDDLFVPEDDPVVTAPAKEQTGPIPINLDDDDDDGVAHGRPTTGSFSPGELIELWNRIKIRRDDIGSSSPAPREPDREGVLGPRVLADLLDAFHQGLTTGELWLERGPGRRVLLLKSGVLVGARSNLVGEDLVSLMAKRGVLSVDDGAKVERLVRSGAFHTAAAGLIALELVSPPVLRGLVEEHVRRVAIGALAWRGGSYRVTLEGRAAKEPVAAKVFVGDAIVHSMLVTESDAALLEMAPDDARFGPATDSGYGLEHLNLSPAEARVVVAMDGTKTIGDLVALCQPLPPRVVRGLAAALFCLHLARLVGRGPASARKISFF